MLLVAPGVTTGPDTLFTDLRKPFAPEVKVCTSKVKAVPPAAAPSLSLATLIVSSTAYPSPGEATATVVVPFAATVTVNDAPVPPPLTSVV